MPQSVATAGCGLVTAHWHQALLTVSCLRMRHVPHFPSLLSPVCAGMCLPACVGLFILVASACGGTRCGGHVCHWPHAKLEQCGAPALEQVQLKLKNIREEVAKSGAVRETAVSLLGQLQAGVAALLEGDADTQQTQQLLPHLTQCGTAIEALKTRM